MTGATQAHPFSLQHSVPLQSEGTAWDHVVISRDPKSSVWPSLVTAGAGRNDSINVFIFVDVNRPWRHAKGEARDLARPVEIEIGVMVGPCLVRRIPNNQNSSLKSPPTGSFYPHA